MKKYILYILLLALFIATPVCAQHRLVSYKQGFYSPQRGGIPLNPNLWKGLAFASSTSLGVTGGTLRDQLLSNHGTLTNMESSDWIIDQNGYVLEFDGTNELVTNSSFALSAITQMTILTKVYQFSTGGSSFGGWLSTTDAHNAGFFLGRDTSNSMQFFTETTKSRTSNATVPLDEFVSLGATYDGTNLHRLFINGSESSYSVQVNGSASITSTGLEIGANTTSNLHAHCKIEYVYIWFRILSDNEIMQVHNDSLALFRTRRMAIGRVPDVAPAARRIILISELMNNLTGGITEIYMNN